MSIENANEMANGVAAGGASFMSLIPMVLIFVIFYFFLIRPQLKRQRQLEKMVSEIKKGDKVIAAGGIYGTVHKIDEGVLSLEISENNFIKVTKSSVTEVLSSEAKPEKENKISEEKIEKIKAKAKTTKPKKVVKK